MTGVLGSPGRQRQSGQPAVLERTDGGADDTGAGSGRVQGAMEEPAESWTLKERGSEGRGKGGGWLRPRASGGDTQSSD